MSSTIKLGGAAGCAVLSLLVMTYSLVIAQQILLGILSVGAIWAIYLFYLLVTALRRIASALERLADQRGETDI